MFVLCYWKLKSWLNFCQLIAFSLGNCPRHGILQRQNNYSLELLLSTRETEVISGRDESVLKAVTEVLGTGNLPQNSFFHCYFVLTEDAQNFAPTLCLQGDPGIVTPGSEPLQPCRKVNWTLTNSWISAILCSWIRAVNLPWKRIKPRNTLFFFRCLSTVSFFVNFSVVFKIRNLLNISSLDLNAKPKVHRTVFAIEM